MALAALLFYHYNDAFMARYGNQFLPVQEQAMKAIPRCRTPAAGEMRIHCIESAVPTTTHSPRGLSMRAVYGDVDSTCVAI